MKIVIDLTSLSYHLTGIERYAMCITDKMIDLDQNNLYILIFRNEITPLFSDRIDGKKIQAVVLHGENKLFFLQITLTNALNKIKADKYIFFAFPSPIMFKKRGVINTIHDMGAWDAAEGMPVLSKYYFRISYRHAVKVSEKIITVSEFSKHRIVEILHVAEMKIAVIHPAVYDGMLRGEVASFDLVKTVYGLPEKYIMTLSTLEPRKNVKILLDTFNTIADQVDYDLVLVGRKGWKMDQVLGQYKTQSRIHITGFVKDEHLSSIYKNALCFVFPSLYEGFGIPPIEALALGTPVISSDFSSLSEVLMDQAVYFRNNSKEDLEVLLKGLDANLKEMARELNEKQKENYSFQHAAREVLKNICIGEIR